MSTYNASRRRRWTTLVALLLASSAPAQFTSTFPQVTMAGNFNGFDTDTPRMRLISNGVWQAYLNFTNVINPQFLFTTPGFATTWKETNQPAAVLPLQGIAEQNNGSDIALTTNFSGTMRARFADASGAYSLFNVTSVEGGGEPWINELHYDNTGTDVDEGVEVAGSAGKSLSGYALYYYNGADGTVYRTTNLTGVIANQASGFGTLFFGLPNNTMENGAPDGVALVKDGTVVLQFISYEGSFTAVSGPADGMTSEDIGVSESSNPLGNSLQLTGTGGGYSEFTWTGPVAHSRGNPNAGQTFVGLPSPVSVTVSNLVNTPSIPVPTNTVSVEADLSPVNGASNLSATAFYRTNGASAFTPLAMTNVSGNHYRTISAIPGQPAGSFVSYYLFINYDGPGTNSPTLYPDGSPGNAASYGVSAIPVGSVWINEINAECASFDSPPESQEFVEIAGVAGTDITGWQLECYDDLTNLFGLYTVTNLTRLARQTNGFGFFVVGDTNVPGVDMVLVGAGNNQLPPSGGMRLRDRVGVTMDAVRYGVDGATFSLFTSVYAGEDFAGFFSDSSLALAGTGGVVTAFTWTTDTLSSGSPGAGNQNQTFTGGNTNPLLPVIVCPTNIYLPCIGSLVPTANVALVAADALCGTGSVLITHVGDTTNTGTGCFGNPRIITRTYRAVQTNCAPFTTNQCTQLIILQDTNPPTLTFPTQQLVNAGFEFGDLTGWTPFGVVSNNVTATVALPRSGFFNGRITAPATAAMYDIGPDSIDGTYLNGPLWNQPGATTGTAKAVLFDGINDKADVPFDDALNNTNFSFAFWVKPTGGQGANRTPLASYDTAGGTRGYLVFASTTNTWEIWTGTGAGSWNIVSGPPVTTGLWVHLAGTYDATGRVLRLYTNGTLAVTASNAGFVPNAARPLRIGAGATEQSFGSFFLPGFIDDVQIYGYSLSAAQVSSLYVGAGSTSATGLAARYTLDENPNAINRTSGLFQAMSSGTGLTWQASAYLAHAAASPLTNSNEVRVALQFLNSTGGVILVTNSQPFNAASPTNLYTRYAVRAVSPLNTAFAQVRVTYVQDTNISPGTVYIDDTVLTPFVVTAGVSCATMPDFRFLVSATDSCGGLTTNQSPAANTLVGGSNITVTFTATDACGLSSQGSIQVSVEDLIAPTVVSYTTNLTASCVSAMPPPNPGGVVATDNCGTGTVSVTLERTTIPTNSGCAGNPKLVVYRYRITDGSGNFTNCDQTITVIDTNAPSVICVQPDLTNGSFEAGTFASWTSFGSFLYVSNFQPRTGIRHAVFYGATNGTQNFSGIYQDLSANAGEVWRAAGYVLQPSDLALQGSNRVEVKIEFLDIFQAPLATNLATFFTSNNYRDVYVPISVTATSPTATARARCTVLLYQPNTPSNAPGTVYLDDFSLTRHLVSVDAATCVGFLPDVANLPIFTDCGTVSISQSPVPGSLVNLGWTNTIISAVDACSQTSRCAMSIRVVDDVSPIIITPPTNIFIQVASTNAVPYPSSNEVVAADNCGEVIITHVSDVNNGASGLPGDPRIITRTYQVADTFSNAVLTRQTITLEGPLPGAPAGVVIRDFVLDTNMFVRSVGTNAWAVRAEYTTNLNQQPPVWNTLTTRLNYSIGGTNFSYFDRPPTNARPTIFRVWQYFP